ISTGAFNNWNTHLLGRSPRAVALTSAGLNAVELVVSMVLKLHGAVRSSATRRAAVVLVEKQVPFEFIVIDTPNKEQKTLEYMKKQPFGQIPLLDDNGFLLYESRAIGRYIAEKYLNQGLPLIPSELRAKALFEQAASSEVANFEFHASQLWKEVVKRLRVGQQPDAERVQQLLVELSSKMDVYDEILSKQRYLAGNVGHFSILLHCQLTRLFPKNITLVDFFPLPYGFSPMIEGSGIIEHDIIERRPHLNRWFKEMSSRNSWAVVKDGVKSFKCVSRSDRNKDTPFQHIN
ncbi:hypothetical protein CVT26_001369, partial [Gymnopilus dilepis]